MVMDETSGVRQGGATVETHPFRAVLVPHRSLSPRGFLILMSFVGVVSFIAGMSFLAMGAWPVMGFFGLDALAVYIAFKLNYRSARRSETVEINASDLTVRRISPDGRQEQVFTLNPYWARVHLAERPDGANRLFLRSHGKLYPIGGFLTDDERRDLADALDRALAAVRARPA
jgi:uncharacterized membrane protein